MKHSQGHKGYERRRRQQGYCKLTHLFNNLKYRLAFTPSELYQEPLGIIRSHPAQAPPNRPLAQAPHQIPDSKTSSLSKPLQIPTTHHHIHADRASLRCTVYASPCWISAFFLIASRMIGCLRCYLGPLKVRLERRLIRAPRTGRYPSGAVGGRCLLMDSLAGVGCGAEGSRDRGSGSCSVRQGGCWD